jgi:CHASE3 domain sensor protein
MPTPEIIERMRQLRSQLADNPDAAHIATELDTVLVEPAHAPRYEGLRGRLQAASASIESRHPQLAASINTVINALNTAGI